MEKFETVYQNEKEWLGEDDTIGLDIWKKKYSDEIIGQMSFKYHFCTLNGVYTVYIRERTNGTYELSISEKGIYINPKIFMDCKTRGLTAVNMTLDDVNEFCDAVRYSDLKNKKQYCLFNI